MGSHVLAPEKVRSERTTRGILAMFLVMGVLAAITITGSGIASATEYTGFYNPRVIDGRIDVNGDGLVTADDNSTNFMGTTDVVEGYFDCDGWDADVSNDFFDASPGDGTENGTGDDCLLEGFDGTTKVYIWVVDGLFTYTAADDDGRRTFIADGYQLPGAYDTGATLGTFTAYDYSGIDWAFRLRNGRVDRDRDGLNDAGVTADDAANLIDPIDVLDGFVDVDNSGGILTDPADDCMGCFYGYDVINGYVQNTGPIYPSVTEGQDGTNGSNGKDGVSGRTTINASSSKNSLNKSKSATCSSTTKVLGGGYSLVGDVATLAHLTVVANGPTSGGWRVRVIEVTPTSGTWQIDVTAVCAIA